MTMFVDEFTNFDYDFAGLDDDLTKKADHFAWLWRLDLSVDEFTN